MKARRVAYPDVSEGGVAECRLPKWPCLMSSQGIGARATGTVPSAGQRVTLNLSQGRELTGTVRWSRQNRFGVHLDTNIDPADFTGSGGSWEVAQRPFGPDHVYDQFKPMERAYRRG